MEKKITPLLDNSSNILVYNFSVGLNPSEVRFWEKFRFELRERGFELFMMGHFPLREHVDIPYVKLHYGLDALRYLKDDNTWLNLDQSELKIDEESVLERERIWCGTEHSKDQLEARKRAIHIYANFYASVLNTVRPVLSVMWNGTHSQSMIFNDVCKKAECPIVYIERGPLVETLFLDEKGILCDSSIAKEPECKWASEGEAEKWRHAMAEIKKAYQAGKSTWWEQPKSIGPENLRKKLGIPSGKKIVMFAGQVKEDSQSFLYSPNFDDNLKAFKWFCDNLPPDDVFILGKHHPKSKQSVRDYQKILGTKGIWISNISLDDCLALADRVAAVNSTVLYEALLMEKPILSMGSFLLSNRNIAYEVNDLKTGSEVIKQWLAAEDFKTRYEEWMNFGAFLLSRALY
ncbi:MAG: hypothetical protein WBD24_06560, partial [Candidatus Omnitrophota bacterium]